MTCRTDSGGRILCPDDPPLGADRLRSVVRWAAVDEILKTGPDLDYTIETDSLGLQPRVSRDGLMGLVGNPLRLYPGLDSNSVEIAFSLAAPGYITRNLKVTLGPDSKFPTDFTPAQAGKPPGTVYLHRQPVVIRGRIVQQDGLNFKPLLFPVTIRIAGVWSTFPAPNQTPINVIEAPNLVSLHPGLYADRDATHALRSQPLTSTGQDKVLVLPSTAGSTTVKLSDRVGVAAGTLLAFEHPPTGVGPRVEYIVVTAVQGASSDDQPATATLAHALRLDHEEGTAVEVMTPSGPTGADNFFTRDGIPGDRVAFLQALAGVGNGVVEIGGGATVEYQTASLYVADSDADGFYRLPPLSRVASVQLITDQAPSQESMLSLDYRRYENFVDVVYP